MSRELEFVTKTGDVVLVVPFRHNWIAQQPDGNWYGFDHKPDFKMSGWAETGFLQEKLDVVLKASVPLWSSTLEEV